ncbi:MAG: S9 family peptidase [Deltaproteobacteria bacterium]|nr:S9 family peptidase [Deltaproteobacteria bacterium]
MRNSVVLLIILSFVFSGCKKEQEKTTVKKKAKIHEPQKAIEKHVLIPRKLLFGNAKKSGLQISPDGRLLAYIAPLNGVKNIHVKTLGKDDEKAVTADTHRGITAYFWNHDSKSMFYLQDKDGNENYRLYQVDLETLKEKLLTPEKGVRAGVIAMRKHIPGKMLISLNMRDNKVFDVYMLDLKTGKIKLDTKNPGNILGWVADYNLKIRAAIAMDKDAKKSLLVRNSVKSPWKTYRTWDYLESGGPLAFSKDGKSLLVMGNKGSDKSRLYSMDLKTRKITDIFKSKKADLSGVILNPDDNHVEAVEFEYFKKELVVVDSSFGKDIEAIRNIAGNLRYGIINRSHDNSRWIVATAGPVSPVKYYLYDRKADNFTLLVETRMELSKYKLSPMNPVSIKSRDGLELVSYLTVPTGKTSGKLPMVLLVHGGPWHRDSWSYDPMVQWLANRGYVVLQVNFRGSTGFGKAFLNAGNKEWGRKMQHDLTDAVKWAINKADVDAKRVAIMGGSYGGYAVLAGMAFTPELYAAGVDIVGPSSIETLLKTIPPYWKPMMAVFSTRVGDLTKDAAMIRERSPLYSAHKIVRPLAVFQGANDPRVKISESDQIVKAVRKSGNEVLYIVYSDEGHGFRRESNRMDFIARSEEFLAKHIGGHVEPFKAVKGTTAKKF